MGGASRRSAGLSRCPSAGPRRSRRRSNASPEAKASRAGIILAYLPYQHILYGNLRSILFHTNYVLLGVACVRATCSC
jgi:hypothetical protein